ncbi:MAG: hypothetical protein ACYTXP_40910 [Nostoc sp.]
MPYAKAKSKNNSYEICTKSYPPPKLTESLDSSNPCIGIRNAQVIDIREVVAKSNFSNIYYE